MILYSFLETNINNYELLKLLRTNNFFKNAESTKEPRFWTCTNIVSRSTCWTGGLCLAEWLAFWGPFNPHHSSSVLLCPRLDLWVECVLPAISVRSSGMTGDYSGFQRFSSLWVQAAGRRCLLQNRWNHPVGLPQAPQAFAVLLSIWSCFRSTDSGNCGELLTVHVCQLHNT